MPLKLVPPRQDKSPNWTIRGTYLKVGVDRSSGTDRRHVARRILRDIERRIERGEFPERQPTTASPTFLSAAIAYMKAGRERDYIAPLIRHFGETPIDEIAQAAIDTAAVTLFPNVTPATRNRKVYTPVSAVLRHAGREIKLKRPKGARGRIITDYLSEDDARAVIGAAQSFDAELALLLRFLLYTGCRLGEALRLRWEDAALPESFARIRDTKNGDPRPLRLRRDLCDDLTAHRGDTQHGRVFRFHKGGGLKELLLRAKLIACGVPIPRRVKGGSRKAPPHRLSWVNFHTFRHTWATWMRRYGGADLQGLVATGNWRDPRSAARYAHAVARDEWQKVEGLPSLLPQRRVVE